MNFRALTSVLLCFILLTAGCKNGEQAEQAENKKAVNPITGSWKGLDNNEREVVLNFQENGQMDMTLSGEKLSPENRTVLTYVLQPATAPQKDENKAAGEADVLEINISDSARSQTVSLFALVKFPEPDQMRLQMSALPGVVPEQWADSLSILLHRMAE